MKKYLIMFLFNALLFAKEEVQSQSSLGYFYVTLFVATVVLFFWGVHKAAKTQKVIYAWALLPFILLMVALFFI